MEKKRIRLLFSSSTFSRLLSLSSLGSKGFPPPFRDCAPSEEGCVTVSLFCDLSSATLIVSILGEMSLHNFTFIDTLYPRKIVSKSVCKITRSANIGLWAIGCNMMMTIIIIIIMSLGYYERQLTFYNTTETLSNLRRWIAAWFAFRSNESSRPAFLAHRE